MTIVLLNGYSSHNVGDWLLCKNSEEIAQSLHPGQRIIAFTMDPRSFEELLGPNVSIYSSPIDPKRLFRSAFTTLVALITGARYGPQHLRDLRNVREAYSVGGGFLQMRSTRETITVILIHVSQLALCRRLQIRVTMLPQSVGPFHGPIARSLARRFMRWFDVVMVREQESLAYLHELDPKLAKRAMLVPDLAFWSSTQSIAARNDRDHNLRIGIVIRQWWFPGDADPANAQLQYLRNIVVLIDRLRKRNIDVRLIVHSDGPTQRGDDRISTQQVLDQLYPPIPVETVVDLPTIKDVMEHYAGFDVIISSRLHASLLSLLVGVPAIALGYEWKSEGIYKAFGLESWHHLIGSWDIDTVERLVIGHRDFPLANVSRHLDESRAELVGVIDSLTSAR